MAGFRCFSQMTPGKQDADLTLMFIVAAGTEESQVGALFAPGETAVIARRGIQEAKCAGFRIEQLNAVSGFLTFGAGGVDGHGQQVAARTKILPGEFRNIAEGGVVAGGESANNQSGAR